MKKKLRRSLVLAGVMGVFVCSSAMAATVPYKSAKHIFSMDDMLGTFSGQTFGENPSFICTVGPCAGFQPKVDPESGAMTYPIDSEFAFIVTDFVGAELKTIDGVYEEGWIGNMFDDYGQVSGVVISSPETPYFKTGGRKGSWCAGLGGNSVKCSAELYTVMEHVLTCTEKVPYFYTGPGWEACVPLDDILYGPDDAEHLFPVNPFTIPPNESDLVNIATGGDYSMTMKDDGKFLYRWGSIHKRPTDVRMYAKLALPDEWKVPGANYTVTKAQLIVNHKITNNPNDQIRPEDFENEGAKGRIPGFVNVGGVMTADRDCYEGDGHFIPAGTLFKDPAYAQGLPVDTDGDGIPDSGGWSSDLQYGYTNAWYTTMDREPFEADEFGRWGARYRLKGPKFGQNLPALEIPIVDCTAPPLRKEDIKYVVGTDDTTVINLLDWAIIGQSPLATSQGWMAYLDADGDGLSDVEGLPLTDDFDVAVYVKGDYKATAIYSVQLLLEYENPAVSTQAELCTDGMDNDGDGAIDCADSDCGGAWCPEANCTDGLDNDEDAYVDCGDPDCAGAVNCLPDAEICTDGIDNDGDGIVDCEDENCRGDAACVPEVCSDGIDNNGDGIVDCDDPRCAVKPYCTGVPPTEVCNDGADNDLDGLTDCADPDCSTVPACITEICNNGIDDNSNGLTDCADLDCVGDPACSVAACSDYTDKTACRAAGCLWNNKKLLCY